MATYKVKTNEKEYDVSVVDTAGGGATVTVEGRTFQVETVGVPAAPAAAHRPAPAPSAPAHPHPAPVRTAAAAPAAAGSGTITAPIPGVVTRLCVKLGEQVCAGQVVLKLEAMKMENDISTPVAGTVKEIAVAAGSEVGDGQTLMVVG